MRTRAAIVVMFWLAGMASVPSYGAPRPQGMDSQGDALLSKTSTEEQPGTNGAVDRSKKEKDSEFTVASRHNWQGLRQDFLLDQKQIWTSPSRLRFADANWLVPVGGLTAALLATDADYSRSLSKDPTTLGHYNTLSNAGIAALAGGAGSMWVLGHVSHNDHWSETGFLAGEAALNSLVAVEAMKYSLRRQRPLQGDGSGPFFQNGGTSFPSEHAAMAWSVAGVIAHEYPGTLTKILVYSLASMVDISRVRARQHFPSDVLVGSLIGNLIAQDIYTRHHDPELGGSEWQPIGKIFHGEGNPENMGSPYVPLDSWIYPAFDRLAALGAVDSGFQGVRPWTRNECVRLLGEASDRVERKGIGGPEAENTYHLLEAEFREDMERMGNEGHLRAQVESLYSRVTGVSGQPLTDGNHFGQTLTNDYGRPYQEGFNSVNGFSVWATAGHLVGYVRAEYQHAPSAAAQPDSARQFIGTVDSGIGVPPATPYSAVNRLELLDAYVGVNFLNWQLNFGKQSLHWSPMQGGPLLFSDNAEPVNMFRISRVSPFKLPSILGWLGPIRVEWFLGQFAGHEFALSDTVLVGQFGRPLDRQPSLQGQKLSFKPTSNFEFSVSTTTVFAGGGIPLTWETFARSYSLGQGSRVVQGGRHDPGDRRSAVDFSYRIPGLRRWLTFYGDALTEDEFSPLGYPRKSAIQGGIYLPRIPGIAKLDLRLEGGITEPVDFPTCNGCFYVNGRYPDGSYMNSGNLVGSWLGRASQGERAWSTYWFSPRNSIQFQYRHQKVEEDYLPRGGTLNDGGVKMDFQFRPNVTFSGLVQYEKWNYPVLAPTERSNWTTSVGVTFWPRNWSLQARESESDIAGKR